MKFNPILFLSIISSCFVLMHPFVQWMFIDALTVFFAPILSLVIFGFFVIVTITTVLYWIKRKDSKPFIIQLATLLLITLFPFQQVLLQIDFNKNKKERESVVSMVYQERLRPNVSYNDRLIELPEEFKHLSKGGGEIVVEKKKGNDFILFYTFRGVLDNFSGFIYSPTDQPPVQGDFASDLKEVKKIEEHWYFISSY